MLALPGNKSVQTNIFCVFVPCGTNMPMHTEKTEPEKSHGAISPARFLQSYMER